MKREFSSGGVVFRKITAQKAQQLAKSVDEEQVAGSGFKILLIKDSYGRWALPKGHVGDTIKGETDEQAALRECSEETGIPAEHLKIIEKLGSIKYFYQLEGNKIFKMVTFFLIESSSDKLNPQCEEVEDAGWFGPEEALARIEYRNSKVLVKKAVEFIRSAK